MVLLNFHLRRFYTDNERRAQYEIGGEEAVSTYLQKVLQVVSNIAAPGPKDTNLDKAQRIIQTWGNIFSDAADYDRLAMVFARTQELHPDFMACDYDVVEMVKRLVDEVLRLRALKQHNDQQMVVIPGITEDVELSVLPSLSPYELLEQEDNDIITMVLVQLDSEHTNALTAPKYLAHWCDTDPVKQRWLLTLVTEDDLTKLRCQEMRLDEALQSTAASSIFIVVDAGLDEIELTEEDEIQLLWDVKQIYYVKKGSNSHLDSYLKEAHRFLCY